MRGLSNGINWFERGASPNCPSIGNSKHRLNKDRIRGIHSFFTYQIHFHRVLGIMRLNKPTENPCSYGAYSPVREKADQKKKKKIASKFSSNTKALGYSKWREKSRKRGEFFCLLFFSEGCRTDSSLKTDSGNSQCKPKPVYHLGLVLALCSPFTLMSLTDHNHCQLAPPLYSKSLSWIIWPLFC